MNARRRRVARRTVLSAVAIFAVLQALFYAWLDTAHPELIDPYLRAKTSAIAALRAARPRDPLVVMLGSSRTEEGFQARRAETLAAREGAAAIVYNLGVIGGGPLVERLAWEQLRRSAGTPAALLVEVMPSLLVDVGGKPRETEWIGPERFDSADWRLLRRFGYPASDIALGWLFSRGFPWHAYRWNAFDRWLPTLMPAERRLRRIDERGAVPPLDAELSRESKRAGFERAEREHRAFLADLELGPLAVASLRELVAGACGSGSFAVLVLMPEGSVVRSWYTPRSRRTLTGLLDSLRADFAVDVVDASPWIDDDGFRDGHHLDRRGAEVFTARMTGDVIAPLIAASPRPYCRGALAATDRGSGQRGRQALTANGRRPRSSGG